MSKKARVVLLSAIAVVLVGAIVGAIGVSQGWGRQQAEPVSVTMPVALSTDGLPDEVKIGVVLTYGSADTEGAEWNEAAQGAAVAAYRYGMGGKNVSVIAENDGGNNDGARQAVAKLAQAGVAGIVIASAGPHVESAVAAAAESGIPAILSYTSQGAQGTSGIWTLAPTQDEINKAITTAIAGATRPLVIEAGGSAVPALTGEQRVSFALGSNVDEFAKDVAARAGIVVDENGEQTTPPVTNPINGIVISADASVQGIIVAALQSKSLNVPIVLTPEAVSSEFSAVLAKNGGTIASNLMTVGVPTGDAIALRKDESGSGMSAFLNAVRFMAGDKEATNLAGDTPFQQVAALADPRSHDAVVSLVQAVAKAGNTEPANVMKALGELRVSTADGLAGDGLDYSSQLAQTGKVVTLFASSQDLGLRGQTGEQTSTVSWVSRPQN